MIKLLIVDDSALMRRLLVQVFAGEPDVETVTARNGVEALRKLQEARPDVVTLDVHMPEMDGLACLERIMAERPCPVVMVSALTAAGAEVTLQALEGGAVDFISKPDGALSLAMEHFAPLVREKIRAAAQARPRAAARRAERARARAVAPARQAAPHQAAAFAGTIHHGPPPQAAAQPAASPAASPALPQPAPERGPPDGIVLVGCSTGGPPALEALLSRLPRDFPWPIVVAQHMPASFTAQMARRLDRQCALSVSEVAAPQALEPGRALIGRGDADIILAKRPGGLVAMPAPASSRYRWHPSVSRLVESALTYVAAGRITGILMTGMGNDGAAAMARVRAEGGRTIAEAEHTAVVWGMPGELVRLGGAGVVAPVEAIAARLVDMLP